MHIGISFFGIFDEVPSLANKALFGYVDFKSRI